MAVTRSFYDPRGRYRLARHPSDTPTVHRVLDAIERKVADGTRFPPSEAVVARVVDAARRDDGMPSQAQLRRLAVLAQQCGLTRADRLELAHMLLGREVRSWSEVTLREAENLGNALEGFGFVAHLQAEQGRRWRYGRCPVEPCPMRTPASVLDVEAKA